MRISDILLKTEIPEQELNGWIIKRFTIDKDRADSFNMHQLFSGYSRPIRPGTYTKMGKVNGGSDDNLWMSDTPAEINDHYLPASAAHGHCLIAGLGLGIITEACLRRDDVTKVTVLEIEEDVIKMVGPYLEEKWGTERLEIIHCDALEWKPPKGVRYGMCWFDIWPSICQDNWDDMKLLHRRYGSKADWKGSWGREEIKIMNREDRYW